MFATSFASFLDDLHVSRIEVLPFWQVTASTVTWAYWAGQTGLPSAHMLTDAQRTLTLPSAAPHNRSSVKMLDLAMSVRKYSTRFAVTT
jgi:hypothetical protein